MEGFLPPVILTLRANASQVYAEMSKVKAATGEAAATADANSAKIAASVSKAGKGFTLLGKGVAIGAVGVIAASTMMATGFQQKMNLLETAADEPAAKVKVISDGVLNLAQSTGTSVDQLAEGAYTVSKAMGTSGAAGQLLVLKAAAQGAKAENVDLATATNALTSVMMSYHEPASKAVQVENELIAASGKSKTTMAEFAGSLSTVIPVASAAHISFAQVGGAIATLTQHGTSADEATQELSSTIRALQAPNAVASKAMQQLGLNVVDVESKLGQRGLTGTIDVVTNAIQKKMGPSGLVVVDAFKKSQSATADLQTELDKMPSTLSSMSKQFESGKMSYKDYYTAAKSLGGQQYELAKGFISTMSQAKGFNQMLTAGNPAAQTFAGYLKQVMGGATGMNTALMLGGENMKTFTADTKDVADAAKKGGSNVSSWALTQKQFNVEAAQLGQTLNVLLIRIGSGLLPVVGGAAKAFTSWFQGLEKNKPALITLASTIGAVLGAALLAYIAHLIVAGVTSVIQFGKMVAAVTIWAAKNVAAFARATAAAVVWSVRSIAAGASWVAASTVQLAQWIAKQVPVLAKSAAMYASYYAKQLASLKASDVKQLALTVAGSAKRLAMDAATMAKSLALKGAGYAKDTALLVASIARQSAAFVAQRAVLIAGAVATGVVTAAQWAWNAAMDANPVTLIILAIIALVAIIVLLVTHWKQVTSFLVTEWQAVSGFFVAIGNGIAKWWAGLWAGIVKWAVDTFGPYVQWTMSVFRGAYEGLVAVGSAISSWWSGLWGGITTWAKDTFQGYLDWTVSVFRGVAGFFQSIGSTISSVWNSIWSGLGSVVRGAFNQAVSIVRGGIDLIIGGINTVIDGINGMTGLASKVGINIPKIGHLPSLDVGGTIPGATNEPVLMIGHGGEEVLSNDMLTGRVPISARVVQAVMASVTGMGASQSAQPAIAGGGAASTSVVVNAVTNASPSQIASTVGWELRRKG